MKHVDIDRLSVFSLRLQHDYNTFLFDFGAANMTTSVQTNSASIALWNDVTPAIGTNRNGSLLNLVSTNGGRSTIGLTILTPFAAVDRNGSATSTVFPASATRD